jgi:hypothetical protein
MRPSTPAGNPVLEEVSSLLTTAERLADRVADLCRRGEPVDNELTGLNRAVAAVVERVTAGEQADLPRIRQLTDRVAAATAAAEARKATLATQLEQLSRHDRVRRAYVRPPT